MLDLLWVQKRHYFCAHGRQRTKDLVVSECKSVDRESGRAQSRLTQKTPRPEASCLPLSERLLDVAILVEIGQATGAQRLHEGEGAASKTKG